ncbi:MAG: adenine glycosylase [Coriobacteriia bacterium]|nr:adenine glycosylase [Coriobacteriia bacterium]MCL2750612.1 adenine glycosylase [Coriobacteriia bacterium]
MKDFDDFIDLVVAEGARLYRDFAWRRTSDPYAVLVSEVMLQQTQTSRVERYFEAWMEKFPVLDALAAASVHDVLEAWQGLGYNRRALALKRAVDEVCEKHGGILPANTQELTALPSIGAATAAGVLSFAHDQFAVYLETNVRAVLLHEFYPAEDGVSDRELKELLSQINERTEAREISAKSWNYALLDYGAHLKKTHPNPSRRSKHHTRQSPYEGSRRQKRARLLEAILASPGQSTENLAELYSYDLDLTKSILTDLAQEGFINKNGKLWTV